MTLTFRESTFRKAILVGDVAYVRAVLQTNEAIPDNSLMFAYRAAQDEIIRLLIQYRNCYSSEVLAKAIADKQVDIAKALIPLVPYDELAYFQHKIWEFDLMHELPDVLERPDYPAHQNEVLAHAAYIGREDLVRSFIQREPKQLDNIHEAVRYACWGNKTRIALSIIDEYKVRDFLRIITSFIWFDQTEVVVRLLEFPENQSNGVLRMFSLACPVSRFRIWLLLKDEATKRFIRREIPSEFLLLEAKTRIPQQLFRRLFLHVS